MALSGDETFGSVVAGFITDADGRLVLTETPDDSTYGVVPGFVTDADGRIGFTHGA